MKLKKRKFFFNNIRVDIYRLYVFFKVATIAKELLDAGTSPTADKIAKEAGTNLPAPVLKLPTSGQGVSSKEQLSYLAQVGLYQDFSSALL